MKRTIKHQYLWALALTGALFLFSCQEKGEIDDLFFPEVETFNMTSSGGVLKFLNGDVILGFPEGAILDPQQFKADVCSGSGECPYLLIPVKIEPFTIFYKPVELSIRFKGCLSSGNKALGGESCIKALNWMNQQDFTDQMMRDPWVCSGIRVNESTGYISLTICQTGVFAFANDLP